MWNMRSLKKMHQQSMRAQFRTCVHIRSTAAEAEQLQLELRPIPGQRLRER